MICIVVISAWKYQISLGSRQPQPMSSLATGPFIFFLLMSPDLRWTAVPESAARRSSHPKKSKISTGACIFKSENDVQRLFLTSAVSDMCTHRFKFEKDQRMAMVSRILTRQLLCLHTGSRSSKDFVVARNAPCKKPIWVRMSRDIFRILGISKCFLCKLRNIRFFSANRDQVPENQKHQFIHFNVSVRHVK